MEELLKSLEWYINSLMTKYGVTREIACRALAESLNQSQVCEKLYMDACYVIETAI